MLSLILLCPTLFPVADIEKGEGMVYDNATALTFRRVTCDNDEYGESTDQC